MLERYNEICNPNEKDETYMKPTETQINENVTMPPRIVLDKTLEKELLQIIETWKDRINFLETVYAQDNPTRNAIGLCRDDINQLLWDIEDGRK